ncbi:LysR family transcriptional regulator ArgP [Pantoea sp. Ap-967]|uniref:LysR family transcriptional regulator ArgP n=1 Tax=Pantoea sp. Ap-967 TaxID=2608362 RepID=UPI0014236CF0|nr:LysR family transcriptional regulator ArgP [Pantoea sp. Ap-967]NIE77150.1 LysR family transcriptional regulator ArgP [Pantoea sp. Ap-967]
MNLVHPQISAFIAVLEEASFEKAAHRLFVTPSAISQRIKALEDRLGQVLIVRETPCRPTPAGERLLRRVRPMQVLETEALADFLPGSSTSAFASSIPIAVNDDSLCTWLVSALAAIHQEHGYLFDIQRDDQGHTLEFLKNGAVMGVVTSEAEALQGCQVHFLGSMRYHAIASPIFIRRFFGEGVTAESLAIAPVIAYNRKDILHSSFIRSLSSTEVSPPVHYLPSVTGLVEAAERDLGWCVVAEGLFEASSNAKKIAEIAPGMHVDEPIYWQHAAVRSDTLLAITRAIKAAAARSLHS